MCSRILDMVHFETSHMNVDQNVNKFLEVPRRTEKKNRIESPFVITFLPSLMQLGSEFVNGF